MKLQNILYLVTFCTLYGLCQDYKSLPFLKELNNENFEEFLKVNPNVVLWLISDKFKNFNILEKNLPIVAELCNKKYRPYAFAYLNVTNITEKMKQYYLDHPYELRIFNNEMQDFYIYDYDVESMFIYFDVIFTNNKRMREIKNETEIEKIISNYENSVIMSCDLDWCISMLIPITAKYLDFGFFYGKPEILKKKIPEIDEKSQQLILHKNYGKETFWLNKNFILDNLEEFFTEHIKFISIPLEPTFLPNLKAQKSNGIILLNSIVKRPHDPINYFFEKYAENNTKLGISYFKLNIENELGRKIASLLEISENELPAIIFINLQNIPKLALYKGKLNQIALTNFIQASNQDIGNFIDWSEKESEKDLNSNSPVKKIISRNFNKEVLELDSTVLVNFCPKHNLMCKKFSTLYNEIAKVLNAQTVIRVKLVEMDPDKNYADMGYSEKYPHLVIYPQKDKQNPVVFEGNLDDKSIIAFISKYSEKVYPDYLKNKENTKKNKIDL